MATRESIQIDFNRAVDQANQIDDVADSLGKLSDTSFAGTLQDISNNWKGDSATAYITKGNALQQKISGTSSNLHNIASTIRTAAKNIYDAELAAIEAAEAAEAAERLRMSTIKLSKKK